MSANVEPGPGVLDRSGCRRSLVDWPHVRCRSRSQQPGGQSRGGKRDTCKPTHVTPVSNDSLSSDAGFRKGMKAEPDQEAKRRESLESYPMCLRSNTDGLPDPYVRVTPAPPSGCRGSLCA